MAYTAQYDSELQIIKVKYEGPLYLNEVKETLTVVLRLVREHDCFFMLTDLRETQVKLSTLSIYELPKIFSEIAASAGMSIYKFKRATIIPEDAEYAHFFETVMVNRGQNLKLFKDADEAKQWLLEDRNKS